MSQIKAKKFADRHCFKLRRVSHSATNQNGYVKVVFADGQELRASDWSQALAIMQFKVFK